MMTLTSLIAATLLIQSQPIQTEAQATVSWVNYCQTQAAAGTNANFREACACVAGLLAGQSTEREYMLMAELAPGLADSQRMADLIDRLVERGYDTEEIQTVGQIMSEAQDDIDRVCTVLE